MCTINAGIEGYKTNHSLKVTTGTPLFQTGFDEKLIMEQMGHDSTNGFSIYKHTSSEQQKQISDILLRSKKPKDTNANCTVTPSTSIPSAATNIMSASGSVASTYVMHSHSQQKMAENLQHMSNLANCSGVCINVKIQ